MICANHCYKWQTVWEVGAYMKYTDSIAIAVWRAVELCVYNLKCVALSRCCAIVFVWVNQFHFVFQHCVCMRYSTHAVLYYYSMQWRFTDQQQRLLKMILLLVIFSLYNTCIQCSCLCYRHYFDERSKGRRGAREGEKGRGSEG